MKTINKWEFKYRGYIKYLCANLSMEPFYIPFINMIFSPCTLLPFFSFVTLPFIDCLLFW